MTHEIIDVCNRQFFFVISQNYNMIESCRLIIILQLPGGIELGDNLSVSSIHSTCNNSSALGGRDVSCWKKINVLVVVDQ